MQWDSREETLSRRSQEKVQSRAKLFPGVKNARANLISVPLHLVAITSRSNLSVRQTNENPILTLRMGSTKRIHGAPCLREQLRCSQVPTSLRLFPHLADFDVLSVMWINFYLGASVVPEYLLPDLRRFGES